MNRIVDLAFIFDLVFTFFTPYTKEDGTIVDEKKDIAVEYAKSWLFPDFIACVPYDLIAYYSNSEDVSKLKIMRGLRLLKLTNMVRILRAGRMFRRYEAENDVNYSALGIYKFSFFILFLAHWMACVWYCITWLDEREVSWVTSYFDSMQSDGTTTTIPDGTLYLASLYWAVATLSTLGYGDVIPQTNAERMFSILCTFMGGAIYAYLLGSVCAIISHLDESSNTFYRQMDALNSFMKEKNLRDDLRVRLRDFFRFRRNSRGIVEWSNVMHLMSDALRLEVAEAVFGKWVRAMPLFEDAPKRLPDLLSAHLSSLVLSPQEDLMANPIRRECVFVIERGLIAHRGWIQPIGTMLGIERIYRDPSRMTFMTVSQPAITLCHSIVLSLNRNALLKVVSEFPKVQKRMHKIVTRIVFREALLNYAKIVIASVNGGVGKRRALNRMLLDRGDKATGMDLFSNRELAAMVESHRLALLKKDHPEPYETLVRATFLIQRIMRGAVARRKVLAKKRRTLEEASRSPECVALIHILRLLGCEKHVETFARLKIERAHLTATSALELSKVTGMSYADAAKVIVTARDSLGYGPNGGGGNVGEKNGGKNSDDGGAVAAAAFQAVENAEERARVATIRASAAERELETLRRDAERDAATARAATAAAEDAKDAATTELVAARGKLIEMEARVNALLASISPDVSPEAKAKEAKPKPPPEALPPTPEPWSTPTGGGAAAAAAEIEDVEIEEVPESAAAQAKAAAAAAGKPKPKPAAAAPAVSPLMAALAKKRENEKKSASAKSGGGGGSLTATSSLMDKLAKHRARTSSSKP